MDTVARAKAEPTTRQEAIFTAVTTACKRWLEGDPMMKEHKSYTFYSGCQIKFFISAKTSNQLERLAGEEGPLVEGETLLGEWLIFPPNGRWNDMLVVTLTDRFCNKPWLITHLARLAPGGFTRSESVTYCRADDGATHCGLPISHYDLKKDPTLTQCARCWHLDDMKTPKELVF